MFMIYFLVLKLFLFIYFFFCVLFIYTIKVLSHFFVFGQLAWQVGKATRHNLTNSMFSFKFNAAY